MPTIEKLLYAIRQDPEYRRKCLIGGLIASIPVINLLIFPYVSRYMAKLNAGDGYYLPEWKVSGLLSRESLPGLIAGILYLIVPLMIAGFVTWIFAGIFNALGLPLFASTVAWFPFMVVLLLAVPVWLTSLWQYHECGELNALWEATAIVRLTLGELRKLLPASLMFLGVIAVGWPLFGFIIFLGIGPFAAYISTAFNLNNQ